MSPLSNEDQTLEYYKLSLPSEVLAPPSGFELDAVKELTRLIPRNALILDAGFGTGDHLAYFLSKGFTCDGFEGSQEVIDFTRNKLQRLFPEDMQRLKLWKADFRTLTLRREGYDAVWANQIFCHLPPAGCQRVMQAFFSALKPQGILFASFYKNESVNESPDQSADENFVHREETTEKDGRKLSRHFYNYPQHEFESMVRQSGFQPLMLGHDKENPTHCAVLAKRI